MLAFLIGVVGLAVLIAELWLGIAVVGWQGDRMFLERSKTPGPYWLMMALHTTITIGLPVLAFISGV